MTIVAGPEEYLFGEEKAMLEVIEGKRAAAPLAAALPARAVRRPPRSSAGRPHELEPGQRGAIGANPTLVNNVETLANVPHILARGAEWFRTMGTAESPGTVVATVVGDVVAPDVGEVEMGTPLAAP